MIRQEGLETGTGWICYSASDKERNPRAGLDHDLKQEQGDNRAARRHAGEEAIKKFGGRRAEGEKKKVETPQSVIADCRCGAATVPWCSVQ